MTLVLLTTAHLLLSLATITLCSLFSTTNDVLSPQKHHLQVTSHQYHHCHPDHDADALEIHTLQFHPSPVVINQPVSVQFKGLVRRDIAEDANIHVLVKLGRFIQIYNQDLKLCEQVSNIDLSCPLTKDQLVSYDSSFQIPNSAPPATYYVTANITDSVGPIACIQAQLDLVLA